MSTSTPQTSRYNPRTFLSFFAGSLTVIFVYVLIGHLPSRQSPATLKAPFSDILPESSSHDVDETIPQVTAPQVTEPQVTEPEVTPSAPAWPGTSKEDGWYTSPEENPYGKEGVDVSELLAPGEFEASNENMKIEHIELRSQMTKDGKWWTTDFLTQDAYNPGFLPHPYRPHTWVMFAQRDKSKDSEDLWNSELVCEAAYHEASQSMKCLEPPIILPIASTFSEKCAGEKYRLLHDQVGPHDARVFNGPNAPYIIYGSQGPRSCLGMYMHDLRRLTPLMYNQSEGTVTHEDEPYFYPTDLQRPPPIGGVEKNWFAFWDMDDQMYLHYDVKPTKRSFAMVKADGSVSEDLAPAATTDDKCMKDLMPSYHHNGREWIHQATNSLSITLCKRSDPDCHPTEDNTFIMLLFQTKTFYMHGVYYPYIMLFRRTAPFEIYGISSKPFWFSGRGKMNEFWRWSTWKPKDQTQMVFTTQMSWQGMDNLYHGYLDDIVIIAFGIEDKHGGGLDVKAEDLLQGMKFCGEAG